MHQTIVVIPKIVRSRALEGIGFTGVMLAGGAILRTPGG
jgi:hypothetical protein